MKEIRKVQYESEAIHCFDMMTETALVKLMWVLGQTKNMGKIREMMQKNYCGEITELSKIVVPL